MVSGYLTPAGVKVGYEYDFGASWQHEITSQKAFMLNPDQLYPVCVAYQGDSPVEYPSEEDPREPEPFTWVPQLCSGLIGESGV